MISAMQESVRRDRERSLWERQAAGYDRQVLRTYRHAYELSIDKARAVLSPEHSVLEIGCGTGIIALGLAPYARQVVGVDISPRMIAMAQGKPEAMQAGNVEFRVCDGYAIPYGGQTFDVVLLFNTLHIVQRPAALLYEAHRLLKPRGPLVTATDATPSRRRLGCSYCWWRSGCSSGWASSLFCTGIRRPICVSCWPINAFDVVDEEELHPAPVKLLSAGAPPGSRASGIS
jgi:ubiquinone/menaquinone biosynthesis C-methylase UbiE